MKLFDPAPRVPPEELGRVHLLGVGGAGMSGVARLLLARGVPVSGCDAVDSEVLAILAELGVSTCVGHSVEHLAGVDAVVSTSAVRETNPEVVEARRRGVPVLHRAAALASLMAGRRGVAVAGTHGKTTTTSLLTIALLHCGADPSYAIGGQLVASGVAAHDGAGDVFVAEADESDGSFLLLSPHVAVVTNVEADHLDNYGTLEAVQDAFARFVDRVAPGGILVACADDPGARALAAYARGRGVDTRTYGESADADLRVDAVELRGLGSAFDLVAHGRTLGRVELSIPGRHNILNAAAALAAGLGLGFPFDDLRDGMAAFTGARRRFELKGEVGGVRVFDSYAHHPTELAADLRAAREIAGEGRVVACFQPHLFSRTRFFAEEFGKALGLADEVVVMDVYAAREDPDPDVTGALVAGAVPLPADRVRFEPSRSAVPALLAETSGPGDIVLTLGAGDVTRIGPEVVALLARASGRADGTGQQVGGRQVGEGGERSEAVRA